MDASGDCDDAIPPQGGCDEETPGGGPAGAAGRGCCCPFYHEAIELVGRRWTGAILRVLIDEDRPMRFSEVGQAVPELSDRLLSARMKELEARGIVERTVHPGPPIRVEYSLSKMGRELGPALTQLQEWAQRWLNRHAAA
jgi:DNA-binding HxlR family transcriptional regulator